MKAAQALKPKPKGRPKGRCGRCRQRVRRNLPSVCALEAQVAYLKIDCPEGAERSQTGTKP